MLPHRDKDFNNGANDDAGDNAKRGTKPRAARKADEYGTRRVCVATTPHDSDNDSDDSDDLADKAAKPRATDKADEATRDCARRVRVAVARKSAMAA